MINKNRTYLEGERESTNRALRRSNAALTPGQKVAMIKQMYRDLHEHLVEGAQDAGVRMDLEEFRWIVESTRMLTPQELSGVDRWFRKMVNLYEGVKHDVQAYVSEERQARAAAQQALQKALS